MPVSNHQTKKLLKRVLQILKTEGWTTGGMHFLRGSVAKPRSKGSYAYCLMGAVYQATAEELNLNFKQVSALIDIENKSRVYGAFDMLEEGIMEWNDTQTGLGDSRYKVPEAVERVLKKSIASCD